MVEPLRHPCTHVYMYACTHIQTHADARASSLQHLHLCFSLALLWPHQGPTLLGLLLQEALVPPRTPLPGRDFSPLHPSSCYLEQAPLRAHMWKEDWWAAGSRPRKEPHVKLGMHLEVKKSGPGLFFPGWATDSKFHLCVTF